MPRLPRPQAIDPQTMTGNEKRLRELFIAKFLEEYQLNESDKVILELAANEYLIALRSQEEQLRLKRVMPYARQDPLSKVARLLTLLGLTRRQRMDARPVESEDEQEMRAFLMNLNQTPLPSGGFQFVVSDGRTDTDASE